MGEDDGVLKNFCIFYCLVNSKYRITSITFQNFNENECVFKNLLNWFSKIISMTDFRIETFKKVSYYFMIKTYLSYLSDK